MTPDQFFEALQAAYDRAAAAVGEVRSRLFIAGVRVEMRFASQVMRLRFAPALAHHPAQFDGEPDLTVCLWEHGHAAGMLPRLPWRYATDRYTADYGTQGEIAGFNDARFGTLHHQWFGELTLIDRAAGRAFYTVRDAAALPYWFSAFPLRSVLHLWSRDRAMQLMHAAAVGSASGGVLIVGASGAGKSTTALACLADDRHGLQIAGDDYIAVDAIGGGAPHVYSLYSVVKLVPQPRIAFPSLLPYALNPGWREDEKIMIGLHAAAPDRLITDYPLRAVVVPRITGARDSRIVPGRAIDALRGLAPTTIFQTIAAKRATFAKLVALVRSVPVLTLEAGTDMAGIPAAIAGLLSERHGEPS